MFQSNSYIIFYVFWLMDVRVFVFVKLKTTKKTNKKLTCLS